jgi:hypothetical protein
MSKAQRGIFSSLLVLVVGGMNAARIANQNGPAFQQHPVASVIGGVTPAILVGIGLYWFLGKKEGPFKMSAAVPWVIGLLAVVALGFLVWVAVDDSPKALPIAAPRQSGEVNGSPQRKETSPQTTPQRAGDASSLPEQHEASLQVAPPQSADAKGSPQRPIRLPSGDSSQCKVKGGPTGSGTFEVEFYNGSAEWHVSQLRVTIKAGDEERTFSLSPREEDVMRVTDSSGSRLTSRRTNLAPLSTGYFSGSIGSFLEGLKQGEWHFSVVDVAGYRL